MAVSCVCTRPLHRIREITGGATAIRGSSIVAAGVSPQQVALGEALVETEGVRLPSSVDKPHRGDRIRTTSTTSVERWSARNHVGTAHCLIRSTLCSSCNGSGGVGSHAIG